MPMIVGMARETGFCLFETALGMCSVAWDGRALSGVQLPEGDEAAVRSRMQRRFPLLQEAVAPAWVQAAIGRIQVLLGGAVDDLADIPLQMEGIPAFHRRVYEVARAIPPGHTLTYGEIAQRLGEPGAARAVGQALGRNPFAPVVPCHRVLAAGSGAGGFSAQGGVATKLRMLQIEKAQLSSEPDLFD
jgi:methylated-DNA-[protein]-cysteine S-methyltransferase